MDTIRYPSKMSADPVTGFQRRTSCAPAYTTETGGLLFCQRHRWASPRFYSDSVTDKADQLANDDPDDDTDFWLSIPGFRESLIEAEADYAAGRTVGEEEIRARFGLPPRGSCETRHPD
jgi:hypothetical protein